MYRSAKVSEGFFIYFISIKAFTDGSAIWLRLAAFFWLLHYVCWYEIRRINKSNLQLSRVHIMYRSANSPSVGFVYYFMSFWNSCHRWENYVALFWKEWKLILNQWICCDGQKCGAACFEIRLYHQDQVWVFVMEGVQ